MVGIKLNKFVIMGEPRSGKTRLLHDIINEMPYAYGFLTKEILGGDERVGFEFIGHDGTQFPFAHISLPSSLRVGKYGVNIAALNVIATQYTTFMPHNTLYLDEIAKMQLSSPAFKDVVREYFRADNPLFATMCVNYCDDVIDEINQNPRVMMFYLRNGNYESTKRELLLRLRHL